MRNWKPVSVKRSTFSSEIIEGVKRTEKLGIGTIKLTKNIDENIQVEFTNEVKSNHIANSINLNTVLWVRL